MTILVRAIFLENNKYYSQVCLDHIRIESIEELKKLILKFIRLYCFDEIIMDRDVNFDILLDEIIKCKDISTSKGPKPLRIRFDKIDGFFKAHGGEFGHLVLFDCLIYGLSDKICEKSKYLISEKSGMTDSINHNFGKIRIHSYNSLSIEKILAFYKVIMLIKSVANKSKNYYYNIFLEKGLYKDKSNT